MSARGAHGLAGAALLSLALHLRAEWGPGWQIYLFKPLTTVLALAMRAAGAASVRYGGAITRAFRVTASAISQGVRGGRCLFNPSLD